MSDARFAVFCVEFLITIDIKNNNHAIMSLCFI